MRSTFFVLRLRLRALRRFLVAQAFTIFVLGPLVAGGALWVVDRYLPLVRVPLAEHLAAGGGAPGTVGLALALLWTVLAVPPALETLYPTRSADAWLDFLPLSEGGRLAVAAASAWTHQLPAGGVVLLALAALAEHDLAWTELAALLLRVVAALTLVSVLALAAAAARVRWGLARRGDGRVLAVLAACLGLALLLAPSWRAYLLLPWWAAAGQLEAALATALAPLLVPGPGAPTSGLAGPGPTVLTLALLLPALALFLRRHRRHDLERVAAGAASRPWRLGTSAGGPTRALLLRDLRLVARRFSPAVHLAVGLAVVLVAAVVVVLPGLGLDPVGERRLAVMGLVIASLVAASLAPFVLAHQLPRFWIEASTPVVPTAVWRAKLWLARVLALPVAVAGVAALVARGLAAAELAVALAQLAVGVWIVASTIGLSVFEVAARPVLGLVFGGLVGLALAALFVVEPRAWWLWVVFYFVASSKLAERASRRVKLTEVGA